MYKKNTNRWLKHLDFILLDVLSIEIAYFLIFVIRNGLHDPQKIELYIEMSIVLFLTDLVCCLLLDTYKNVLRVTHLSDLLASIKQSFFIETVLLFYYFISQRGKLHSRLMFILLPLFYILIGTTFRIILKQFLRKRTDAKSHKSMFLITTSDLAEQTIVDIEKGSLGEYSITGMTLLDQVDSPALKSNVERVEEKDLLEYLCRNWVDEVYVSLSEKQMIPDDIIEKIIEMGIVVHIEIAKWKGIKARQQFTEKIGDTMVLTTSINSLTATQALVKRAFDIFVGIVGCLITLILIVVLGPMIYIKSPGNIFFSQTRIGRNGKTFKIYKFRSMYLDAEKRKAELMEQNKMSGLMFKLDYDPRIIGCRKLPDGTIKKGIGNYIRDLSLDEFPQFFNVLKGDMSTIGTRPPTMDEWEKYDLHHRARLAMKPGITGMWQVSGRSNITDFEEVVKLDRKYLTEWSLALDLRIFFKTIEVVLKKDGAV